MLFLENKKDYKTVTTALRRELKALGLPPVSPAQMFEVLSKALGHKNWATLQVAQPPKAPKAKPTYGLEADDAEDDARFKGYRLFNKQGHYDLSREGVLVNGFSGLIANAALEDVLAVTVMVDSVTRKRDGNLDLHGCDETDYDTGSSEHRKDRRGQYLWGYEADALPQDRLLVAPEMSGYKPNVDFLDSDYSNRCPLRQDIIEGAHRWLLDKSLVDQALEELAAGDFVLLARRWGVELSETVSAIGQAQYAVGFGLHLREFGVLQLLLKSSTSSKS